MGCAGISRMSSSPEESVRQSFDSYTPISSNTKTESAWNTVKRSFKARSSLPNLRRWLSSTRASDPPNLEEHGRQTDKQEGSFCDSLLGLMERTGRFDYIDYRKDSEGKASSEDEEEINDRKRIESRISRSMRFSWSR